MDLKKAAVLLLLLGNWSIFSQESNPPPKENNQSLITNSAIKHQIGIGISKFINSAFASDKNAYDINYRYHYSEKMSLRAAGIYNSDDSDGGFVEMGLKLGIDRRLKKYDDWSFYYGIDAMTTYSNYNNVNKDQYMIGVLPFLGIQYNLSKNFSFSIEPGIYVRHNIVIDNSTFDTDNRTSWTESGLGKLGYINVNFHF